MKTKDWIKKTKDNTLSKGVHCGLKWMTKHNGFGFRCGYVAVPLGHPCCWMSYDNEKLNCISVHGGLTFDYTDEKCRETWFGFDCAHYNDAPDPKLPGSERMVETYNSFMMGAANIRTQEYVEDECRSLCEQLAKTV